MVVEAIIKARNSSSPNEQAPLLRDITNPPFTDSWIIIVSGTCSLLSGSAFFREAWLLRLKHIGASGAVVDAFTNSTIKGIGSMYSGLDRMNEGERGGTGRAGEEPGVQATRNTEHLEETGVGRPPSRHSCRPSRAGIACASQDRASITWT